MTFRPAAPIAALLVLACLAGCGASRASLPSGTFLRPGDRTQRPGAAPFAAKRAGKVAARAADVVPLPATAPEFRLALTEDGFLRLRDAFPWKAQAPRTDYYFDAWDGTGYRRQADPGAAKLRLKVRADKVEWQISRVVERREVARIGLPIGLTVNRAWEDRLEGPVATHLLQRTQEFFLWLDDGGEPLRQRAREVDVAWKNLTWIGADLFFPAGSVPGAEPPALFPSAMKRRHGWTTKVPRDEVGGGLELFMHFDEARDADGRWVDTFEIEAEPLDKLPPEGYEAAAVDFGKALAAAGLTADDVAPDRSDATAFTTRQLQR